MSVSKRSSGFASAAIKSMSRWKRKPSDSYQTPANGVETVMPFLRQMRAADGGPIRRIWEPACGEGMIARVAEHHGYDVVASDIVRDGGYGIGGHDFLTGDPARVAAGPGSIDLIITNPPFALAEQFVRRAAALAPNVALLLKATYWSARSRLELWNEHPPSIEVKLTRRLAFLKKERGDSPLMDCSWYLWIAGGEGRSCVTIPALELTYPGYHETGIETASRLLAGAATRLVSTLGDGHGRR